MMEEPRLTTNSYLIAESFRRASLTSIESDVAYFIIHNGGGQTLKSSDPSTGFRLPKTMLATVDSICAKQDLTRSKLFRRSILEYLSRQNATVTEVQPPEPQRPWPAELFSTSALKSTTQSLPSSRTSAISAATVFSLSPGVLTGRTERSLIVVGTCPADFLIVIRA